jgi:hypothetical protein
MKNATMFTVGLLTIAMLVGLGASAGAPAEFEYETETAEKAQGQFMEAEGPTQHIHTLWELDWNVVGSTGGAYTCVGGCPDDSPEIRY